MNPLGSATSLFNTTPPLSLDPADQEIQNQVAQAVVGLGNLKPVASLALGQLLSEVAKLNKKTVGDGVNNANGAPTLADAITDFSGDELALILSKIDTQIKDAQASTAKEGIEHTREQTDTANKEMLKKLAEAIEKQKEAAEKAKSEKVWGWIGKIAAFIGAVVAVVVAAVATVASGGAAAPLLALAVIGFVAATVDLANQINQEIHPDAEPFTLGSLIGDAIIDAMDKAGIEGKGRAAASGLAAGLGFLLMQPDLAGQMAGDAALADGKSQEFADQVKMGVMFAAVATTIIAMIAVTIASGGSSSANLASGTLKNVMKAAQYVGVVTSLVQGTAAVGQGATNISIAVDEKAAALARAAAKEMDAVILMLQQQAEEQTERLRDIITALQEGSQMFTQMVANASDQRANTVRNMVQG
jgi:transloator